MTNNEILNNNRHILALDEKQMVSIYTYAASNTSASIEEVNGWSKKDGDQTHIKLSDKDLAFFLNGLIIHLRGKKEGQKSTVEDELSNNAKFMKLKIALNLQADQILDIFRLAEFELSKHELSAFFRKPGHKHFRHCKDETLRAFLTGLSRQDTL